MCDVTDRRSSPEPEFLDPRHQFHGIGRLVSGLLFRGLFIATYAGGNDSRESFALLKGTQD